MDIKTEFRLVTFGLFFLQIIFTLASVCGFFLVYKNGKFIDLFTSVFLLYFGMSYYALGKFYRKEFGLRIKNLKGINLSKLPRILRRKYTRQIKKQK